MINKKIVGSFLVVTTAIFAIAAARPFFGPAQQEEVQPTEQHKMLLKGVGEWEGELTFAIPGQEPATMPAKESVTAVGEFWTQSNFHCDMGPGPFDGVALTGYDIKKGKFVGTWIDNVSTSITLMEGSFDEKTKTLTMHYEGQDMMTGEPAQQRIETVFTADTYVSSFFDAATKGNKTMVISMKRKVAAKKAEGAK